ncbi:MAG: heavy metal translocating P-type ATPase [Erysipelotrichaceae bacterium]|nr:heavy metal translocating P-type ATPase [Erysipelotrichaceae bacterium]
MPWNCICKKQPNIHEVKVYERTRDVVVWYQGIRQEVISLFSDLSLSQLEPEEAQTGVSTRQINREFEEKIIGSVLGRIGIKWFCPSWLRMLVTLYKAIPFVKEGLKTLWQGKIEVPVLDATAIGVSLIRQDYDTAGSIMFLLGVGDHLEQWTHKKSVNDLARTMSLNVDKVWVKADGQETLTDITEVKLHDRIIVRMGHVIPLDGVVQEGTVMVNQSSMTGESLPVEKGVGSYIYAGTVVEEGQGEIEVRKEAGTGHYDQILRMIEESQRLKSEAEDKAGHLADALVPYSLFGTLFTYLLTRDINRAISILMVDYSCALKLAMPIAVLSAMKESSKHHIQVKGGRFLETLSQADTIVFDKTGTLTYAKPTVRKVVAFGQQSEEEMLRLAACLEEHYPHTIANAVVEKAAREGLVHEEKHSKVEYVIAHGVASRIDGKKVIIGSYHFVFQDEHARIRKKDREKFDSLPQDCTLLYMAISGWLEAVICIDDPLREEAEDVIARLHASGFDNIVMMTGDSHKSAEQIARKVHMDDYYAEVLPDEKASFIQQQRENGHTVVMIGDGINDSPALSEADVGIAVSSGTVIAQNISDITIREDDLYTLVHLKEISDSLMQRIQNNYRFIMGFNSLLILLGAAGILAPTTSALLHNSSTIGISLQSMRPLMEL